MLSLVTPKKSHKDIRSYWVYKLSVRDVSLIFEANNLSCFGFWNRKEKFNQFLKEYNELFNNGADEELFDVERLLLKMHVKSMKLRAIYDSLASCEGEKANGLFKELFGREFSYKKDFDFLLTKIKNINEKIKIILKSNQDQKSNKNKLTFPELVLLVESSRGIPIDRNTKLYEFKKIYDSELEKNKNGRH